MTRCKVWQHVLLQFLCVAIVLWYGEQCTETEEHLRQNNSKRAYQLVKDLTTVKQGKGTTVQDRSGKCLTEERQILNRWTEYCSELYNHKANGDPSVLSYLQTDIEDDHPILREEVEAAVQSLKKREISWSRQHPGRTVPSRRRGRNHHFHDNLQQDLADRRMANTVDPVLSHHNFHERQPAAVPELPND